MAQTPVTVEVNFSQQARRQIEKMIKALELQAKNSTGQLSLDENVIYTVHDTMVDSGLTSEQAKTAIQALKNAGIVFAQV